MCKNALVKAACLVRPTVIKDKLHVQMPSISSIILITICFSFFRNALGEATCSARLTVIEDKLHGRMLPKFLRKFDHLNVKDGEEAKFSCVIVGEPKADVVWMYDHKPIPVSVLSDTKTIDLGKPGCLRLEF